MSLFITFEGPDGSGKTSVADSIEEMLRLEGYDILRTREPGGTPIAEDIRAIILGKRKELLDPRAEALLFAASRRQHLIEKIWPALKQGKIVICDRFVDSSLAYQGGARELGVEEVLTINEFATEKRMPDLTLLFDIRPEIGVERIKSNEEREVNRLDLEAMNFHERARNTFLQLAQRWPERIVIIDAEQSLQDVIEDAYKVIKAKLENI
ncbi:MAG: dTMP kinase [Erysipelotrichaceae bacterium]|nr:dTMP kinase [Erysipelotrichaceae bacterium]